MRIGKKILLIAVFVCLLTACGENSIPEDSSPDVQIQEEIKIEVPETEQTDDDVNAAYEEYLETLQYLDEIESRLSDAATTVDMVSAAKEAFDGWDKELNQIYTQLLEKLPTEQLDELKTIQRLWVKERDRLAAEYASSFDGGSFYQVAYNDILFQCTKQRTLELVAVYVKNSNDFSFELNENGNLFEETQANTAIQSVSFDTYNIDKKYYGENGNYVELILKLPRLQGNYKGIPVINDYFAEKEQFFYEQLPFETMEAGDHLIIDGQAAGYFVSAHYYMETQIGNIISITAVLDGGAGGVSWAGLEGNTFNLETGKKIELFELFQVSEEEYMSIIYDYISNQITKEIQAGAAGYFFQDAYSEDGIASIRGWNKDNFILSNSGLLIFYEKYELAYGAAGVQVYEIPYDLIRDILLIDI